MLKFIILPLLLVNMLLALDIGNRDNFEFSKPEHDIYFVNGMGNTEKEAKRNLDELRIFLASKQIHQADGWENFDYKKNLKLAYNFKEEPLVELYEAYKQASNDNDEVLNWEDFLKQLNGIVDIALDLKKSKAGKIKNRILFVAEMYANYLVGFTDVNQDPDLLEHIEQYRLSLLSGKKVVLVAHSQGNFYANLAYEELHKMYKDYPNSGDNLSESISIVGVATVSSKLRADKEYKYYTTFHDDKVWQKVKGLYDTTLDSNELARICPDKDSAYKVSEYAVDLSCHSFSGTYLNENNTARNAIYNYIILSSNQLAKNPKLKLEVDRKQELLNCNKKYTYGLSNVDIENAVKDYSYYFKYDNVYPFNLNEKKLYKVPHQDGTQNYVSASNGGDLIQYLWSEQKENECYRLNGTGEIISQEGDSHVTVIYPQNGKYYSLSTCNSNPRSFLYLKGSVSSENEKFIKIVVDNKYTYYKLVSGLKFWYMLPIINKELNTVQNHIIKVYSTDKDKNVISKSTDVSFRVKVYRRSCGRSMW
jgi:hypothetical protein